MRPTCCPKWEFTSERFSCFWWNSESMRTRFGLILKITVSERISKITARTKSYVSLKNAISQNHQIHERNYHSFQNPTPIIPTATETIYPQKWTITFAFPITAFCKKYDVFNSLYRHRTRKSQFRRWQNIIGENMNIPILRFKRCKGYDL